MKKWTHIALLLLIACTTPEILGGKKKKTAATDSSAAASAAAASATEESAESTDNQDDTELTTISSTRRRRGLSFSGSVLGMGGLLQQSRSTDGTRRSLRETHEGNDVYIAAATAAAESARRTLADVQSHAAHAHGAAGNAQQALVSARQALSQIQAALSATQEAQEQATKAARDAALNAQSIRNITPIIFAIGAYSLYTSVILAPKFKRHSTDVPLNILRKIKKIRKSVKR